MEPSATEIGFLAPNANGNQSPVMHLQCGSTLSSVRYRRWSSLELKRYVSYHVNDQPTDAFFRAFLFSPNGMHSGRFLNPLYVGFADPANPDDWREWLVELLAEGGNLDALAQTIRSSPQTNRRADVWITLPYPSRLQHEFDVLSAKRLDLGVSENRVLALRWWILLFLRKWNAVAYRDVLRLRGFRWGKEAIMDDELQTIKDIANTIHGQGLQFMWVSNFGASRLVEWNNLGFDVATVHSNYYGNIPYGVDWIDNCTLFCRTFHCGMQITCGKGLLYDDYHVYDYLNKGLPDAGDYMTQAFILFNLENTDLNHIYLTHRTLYDDFYRFLTGTFTKFAYPGISY